MRKLSSIVVMSLSLMSLALANTTIHAHGHEQGSALQGGKTQGSSSQGSRLQGRKRQGSSLQKNDGQGKQRQAEKGSFDFGAMKLEKIQLGTGDAVKGSAE
jgi:hypothetical protein